VKVKNYWGRFGNHGTAIEVGASPQVVKPRVGGDRSRDQLGPILMSRPSKADDPVSIFCSNAPLQLAGTTDARWLGDSN
jgi:hypothetical protein